MSSTITQWGTLRKVRTWIAVQDSVLKHPSRLRRVTRASRLRWWPHLRHHPLPHCPISQCRRIEPVLKAFVLQAIPYSEQTKGNG